MTLTFVLVSQPVLTTGTYVVAWPQGDRLLGGGPWHKANLPATHWLSLPFYTPEGAWRLSWQIPGIHRGLPKGRSRWISDQAKLSHPSDYGASSGASSSPSNCQALVARPCLRHQSRRRCLGIPGHLDRPRRSRPDPSLPLHLHYLRRCCRRQGEPNCEL